MKRKPKLDQFGRSPEEAARDRLLTSFCRLDKDHQQLVRDLISALAEPVREEARHGA
jgi:hypothetical protein